MEILLLLLTIIDSILAVCLIFTALLLKQSWLAKFTLGALIIWFVTYALLLLGFSFASQEKILAFNEAKAFCGFYLDCHIHAAVTAVRKTKTIGNQTAAGDFYIVRVKVSNNAKRAELNLWQPKFEVVDANNNRFGRIIVLENSKSSWEQKVLARGAFEKEVVFDLPINVENPRLNISEGTGINKLIELVLIGDEDSLWHKRVLFELQPRQQITSLQQKLRKHLVKMLSADKVHLREKFDPHRFKSTNLLKDYKKYNTRYSRVKSTMPI